MTSLRFGILGTGRMAAAFATEVQALASAGIVAAAVGSRHLAAAERFAAAHGIRRGHGSYEALAHDPEIDVIYIATPHSYHEAHTLLCLKCGKHVLCEKPFALNAAQASHMIDTARRHGRFLMEAMWTRFLPAVSALRVQLARNVLGRIQLIVGGGAYIPADDPDHYLLQPALGGGALLDAGVYLVSFASSVLGSPKRVCAAGAIGPTRVDEQDVWLAEYAGGAHAMLYVSLRARRAPDLEILGEHGRILVHAPLFRPTRLTVARLGHEDQIQDYPCEGSGYRYQALEVLRCVREGCAESAQMTLAETHAVMVTMDEIRSQIGLRYPGE
jgi:predicted dehydrogenase